MFHLFGKYRSLVLHTQISLHTFVNPYEKGAVSEGVDNLFENRFGVSKKDTDICIRFKRETGKCDVLMR